MSRIDCEDSKATLKTCCPVYLTKKCCMAPASDNSRFKFLSKLAISNTFKVSFSNYVLFRNNSKPHVYRAAKLKLIHKHSLFACFFFFLQTYMTECHSLKRCHLHTCVTFFFARVLLNRTILPSKSRCSVKKKNQLEMPKTTCTCCSSDVMV